MPASEIQTEVPPMLHEMQPLFFERAIQSFLTFPLELAGFAAISGAAVASNAFADDRRIEFEDVTVAVRLPQRSVRVQLDISNFGPSRHNTFLSK